MTLNFAASRPTASPTAPLPGDFPTGRTVGRDTRGLSEMSEAEVLLIGGRAGGREVARAVARRGPGRGLTPAGPPGTADASRGGQVVFRVMSPGLTRTTSGAAGSCWRTWSSSMRAAMRPWLRTSWPMVVRSNR